jgi:hypothetical protein
LELYQTDRLAEIVGDPAMIEILGHIFGIGFLIWLTAFIILYAVAKHYEDR